MERPTPVRYRPPHHSSVLDVFLKAEVASGITEVLGCGLLRFGLSRIGGLGFIASGEGIGDQGRRLVPRPHDHQR